MSLPCEELPPRARRIQAKSCNGGSFDRNYLRVRGEYGYRPIAGTHPRELPPRARRILLEP